MTSTLQRTGLTWIENDEHHEERDLDAIKLDEVEEIDEGRGLVLPAQGHAAQGGVGEEGLLKPLPLGTHFPSLVDEDDGESALLDQHEAVLHRNRLDA